MKKGKNKSQSKNIKSNKNREQHIENFQNTSFKNKTRQIFEETNKRQKITCK